MIGVDKRSEQRRIDAQKTQERNELNQKLWNYLGPESDAQKETIKQDLTPKLSFEAVLNESLARPMKKARRKNTLESGKGDFASKNAWGMNPDLLNED